MTLIKLKSNESQYAFVRNKVYSNTGRYYYREDLILILKLMLPDNTQILPSYIRAPQAFFRDIMLEGEFVSILETNFDKLYTYDKG